MKHLRIPALMLLTLLIGTCLAGAGAESPSPAPFTDADVQQISEGLATVGDYAAALSPTRCAWTYQGAATGETWLTLVSTAADGAELGEATIAVTAEDGAIGGAEDGESAALPGGLQDLEARLIGARWLNGDYALPVIRGIAPGAAAQDVVSAFFSYSDEYPDYAAQDINPDVDDTWSIGEDALIGGFSFEDEDGGVDYVYGWCTLDAPDEWREYDQLTYQTAGGFVREIELTYSTDPE